jgi:hypothetical protein
VYLVSAEMRDVWYTLVYLLHDLLVLLKCTLVYVWCPCGFAKPRIHIIRQSALLEPPLQPIGECLPAQSEFSPDVCGIPASLALHDIIAGV